MTKSSLLVCLFLLLQPAELVLLDHQTKARNTNDTLVANTSSQRPFGYCFYSVLGLPIGASMEDVDNTYLELRREYPPNSGNQETEEIYQQITEAYDVLGVKYTKDVYDQNGGMKGYETWERGYVKPPPVYAKAHTDEHGRLTVVLSMDSSTSNAITMTEDEDEDEDEDISVILWGDYGRPFNYCFYAVLQLNRRLAATWTTQDFEAAYSLLLKKYPANSVGKDLFMHKKIKEAYQVLSNTQLKEMYDTSGMEGFQEWEFEQRMERRRDYVKGLEMEVRGLFEDLANMIVDKIHAGYPADSVIKEVLMNEKVKEAVQVLRNTQVKGLEIKLEDMIEDLSDMVLGKVFAGQKNDTISIVGNS